MKFCWEILFSVVCFVVVGIIPYASLYLEAGNDDLSIDSAPRSTFQKVSSSIKYAAMSTCTFFLIQILLYFTFNSTDIPVRTYAASVTDTVSTSFVFEDDAPDVSSIINMAIPSAQFDDVTSETTYIYFPVNFAVYIMAFFGWLGWWPFAVFVGVGLAAVPFELIYAYRHRPRPLTPDELVICTSDLQDRTAELLEISEIMKRERKAFKATRPGFGETRRRMMMDRMELNKLEAMVYILERDTEELRNCKDSNKGIKPLIPYFKLFVGLFFGLLTMLWICQICLYLLSDPPKSSFLNAYFISFDSWFPMFGNITYALFSVYLLLCTVVGCFKFGVNLFCIKIHPMKVGETYLSSFLFNVGVILLCTVPVVQFCNEAFADYAHYSDVYLLLGVQVVYMSFFHYFYSTHFFIWVIVLAWALMLLYLFRKPRDEAGSTEDFRKQLQERATGDSTEIEIQNEENPMKAKSKGSKVGKGKRKDKAVDRTSTAEPTKGTNKKPKKGGVGKGAVRSGKGVGVGKSRGKKSP
jgi:LMBR1 domain-containing protein 1